VLVAIPVLASGHKLLRAAEEAQAAELRTPEREEDAMLATATAEELGDAS
jgi:hypothetical protein